MDLEQSCEDDNDCNPNFYCYTISKRCVQFTLCSRYNRAKGSAPARSATQCGPCIPGYATETLADGKENPICQQKVTNEKHYIGFTTDQFNKIWIYGGVFPLILLVIVILLYVIKKRYIFRKWYNTINCFASNDTANFDEINTHVAINATNNALTIATAPEEQSPFIECITDKYRIYDNNESTIDNECQTATPCAPPRWVNATQFDNNNTDIPNERNIVAQNNIPDNNQPAHEIQLSIAEAPEVNTEQQDNARNTLLQIYSSDNDENPSHETNKSPFIECITDKYRIYDNNESTIDNECQTATPCAPPRWVNATQFDNNNTDIPNERNIVAQNNIPDNNQPAHEIQLSIAEAPEVNTEQQDNARNTLLQIYSSDNDENPSHETNKSNNNNKMKNIIINQSVNQNITMNLNVFKEDEC